MANWLEDLASDIPIIGGLFGDTESDLREQQQKRYEQMQERYRAQAEPLRQARMQALQQTMNLFQPATDLMKRQYGTSYDFGNLFADPMQGFEQKTEQNIRENQQRAIAEAEADKTIRGLNLWGSGGPIGVATGKVGDLRYKSFEDLDKAGFNIPKSVRTKIKFNPETNRWERV